MLWIITIGFGLVAIGLLISLTYSLKGGPASGAAACLFTIALAQRFMGSRIVLRFSTMTVVNPLVTYNVPYATITAIRGGGGETLNLVTRGGDEIYSVAFGGSILDSIFKTTDRAVERIKDRAQKGHRSTQKQVVKTFRISWIADACTVGAFSCAILAGVLGI
ncbi:hypothetical protein [Streptomyces sp. NPDC058855]|uniref:hypothetical protein n=1 Tax=Streptomyces sp. NPDC058855 TaxID=3346651 RepID=UPI0036CA8376